MERIKAFDDFSKQVVHQMDNARARKDTKEEIYSHLTELADAFINQGMTAAEAQRSAIESMANATDLGIKLDKVHTPKMNWWNYALLILVLLAIISAAFFYITMYTRGVHEKIEVVPDKTVEVIIYEIL